MGAATTDKTGSIVVSALSARANFGKLLDRVDGERRSLVIEKRGTPKAVLLSIRDYVKLAAPEPGVGGLGPWRRRPRRCVLTPGTVSSHRGR